MLKINRTSATVLAAVLALVLAAAMIACSGSQEPATPTSEPTKSQAETTKSPKGIASAAEVSTPEASADAKKVAVAAPDAALVSQSVAATAQGNGQAGIWVNGIGTKDVEADVAVISIGVESREETVAAARSAAAASMTSVLDALGTLGVADDDIVTTSLNIYPIQVWIEVKDDVGSHNEPRITGYVVNNQVRVTVRDIEMADEVIDKAAEVGGDLIRINNVSFTVGDPAAHADEIRVRGLLKTPRPRLSFTPRRSGWNWGRWCSCRNRPARGRLTRAKSVWKWQWPCRPTPVRRSSRATSASRSRSRQDSRYCFGQLRQIIARGIADVTSACPSRW